MTNVPRARELVLQHGWNATAYQIVNPGIEHWFSERGDAVVGFVTRHGVCVIAGAPVCARERLEEVLAEWENYARLKGCKVCYFGAAGRVYNLLSARRAYATVVLGAQPVWHPARWPEIVAAHASLRAQLRRAVNKGVSVEEWLPERATQNPQLKKCLDEWLARRGLPPLHFLVEPQTLDDTQGRRIFVALRNGTAIGFLTASPVPCRRGWLSEQFVRGRDAPNGTVELLLDTMMRAVAKDGAEYVTMGLVPLSQHTSLAPDFNPFWLRMLLAWIRAHGRRFYNFDGLDAFKSKFRPQSWEPIYAISSEPNFSPHSLYAIAAAFSGQPPLRAVMYALFKAAKQEMQWLKSLEKMQKSTAG
ncbi:MAG TPA: DUF2156 domain-containing protein [Abditibacteriaceae bacterium]